MYIYFALINALCAHMTHINLNMILYTHVEHSPIKTIYIKYYTKTHTHTHTHARTHARTHASTQTQTHARTHKQTNKREKTQPPWTTTTNRQPDNQTTNKQTKHSRLPITQTDSANHVVTVNNYSVWKPERWPPCLPHTSESVATERKTAWISNQT